MLVTLTTPSARGDRETDGGGGGGGGSVNYVLIIRVTFACFGC